MAAIQLATARQAMPCQFRVNRRKPGRKTAGAGGGPSYEAYRDDSTLHPAKDRPAGRQLFDRTGGRSCNCRERFLSDKCELVNTIAYESASIRGSTTAIDQTQGGTASGLSPPEMLWRGEPKLPVGPDSMIFDVIMPAHRGRHGIIIGCALGKAFTTHPAPGRT